MPSGHTHDRITLWSLPLVTGLTLGQTQNSNLTLLVTGGFLFSGLMFGPDLDTYSRHYQRWGLLRWMWIPYQYSLHHRSFLSHGPLIGTALRILYLGLWVSLMALVILLSGQLIWNLNWTIPGLFNKMWQFLQLHYTESIALFIGLELGAMSHVISDWSGSLYKRCKKQGWRGLVPKTPKRRSRRR